MFGLGMMEIIMILAIALIVVGPKKLPELAKTLGRAMGEFKRSAQDLKQSIDVETTIKDVDIPKTDIKEILDDSSNKTDSIQPSPYPEEKDNITQESVQEPKNKPADSTKDSDIAQ